MNTLEPHPAPIRVLFADVSPLADARLMERALTLLPPSRREKAQRCVRAEEKHLSVGASLLLLRAVRDAGIPAETFADLPPLSLGRHGKPFFPDLPGFCFSLSHAGHYAMCAASDTPVGCDLEAVRPFDVRVAKRFFSPEEYALTVSFPAAEGASPVSDPRAAAFCGIWTRKESFIKALGKGLTLPLPSFTVPAANGWQTVRQAADPGCWLTAPLDAPAGYAAAVCAREARELLTEWVPLNGLL